MQRLLSLWFLTKELMSITELKEEYEEISIELQEWKKNAQI